MRRGRRRAEGPVASPSTDAAIFCSNTYPPAGYITVHCNPLNMCVNKPPCVQIFSRETNCDVFITYTKPYVHYLLLCGRRSDFAIKQYFVYVGICHHMGTKQRATDVMAALAQMKDEKREMRSPPSCATCCTSTSQGAFIKLGCQGTNKGVWCTLL